LLAAVEIPFVNKTIMAKKKKNTGVPYEKLVQGIFQAIHEQGLKDGR
jgi:hypothetical protein